jgi:type I restriction enzyme S subunit
VTSSPAGWKEVRLSEIADVDPENLSSATSPYYQFKYVSLENVSKGRLVGFSEQVFHAAPSRARRILKDLDVLLATVRPNLLGHFLFRGRNNWVGSTGFAVVRCRSDLYSPTFMSQLVFSHVIQAQIELLITGSNYPAINSKDVRELRVPLPPLMEQEAIAEALSDADAAIEALDALIAKKRDVKQATMQQLLTGRTRLPGFTADWKEVRLGECLTIMHGKNQSQIVDPEGRYPILATGGVIGRTNSYLSNKPSVLIGRKGTIDRPQYMDTPFWTVDTLFYSEVKSGNSAKFLFYKFLMVDWKKYNEASGVPSLNASTIENVEMVLPPLKEQEAIAETLSAMDDELEALTEQASKLRMVKQGMMQDLLTGKVRLV